MIQFVRELQIKKADLKLLFLTTLMVAIPALAQQMPQVNAITVTNSTEQNKYLPLDVQSLLNKKLYQSALNPISRLANLSNNAEAQYWMGHYYQCGKIVPFNCNLAQNFYQKAVNNGDANLKNKALAELAWINATCQQTGFINNYTFALQTAQQQVQLSANPFNTDTLAASFAANNQFVQAVQTQKQAISLLAEFEKTTWVSFYNKQAFNNHLQRFEKKQTIVLNEHNAKAHCSLFSEPE